jgi:methionyl-tRNA formyltransferase
VRVLFLGTPEFAVPTLKELLADSECTVVGVVCQPDRPAGRGNKLHAPPTKVLALEHNIPVLQPVSLAKSPETVEAMRKLEPDIIVMVAFGQILKKAVLEMPKMGVVNVHASLLPELRGAAPINWSIINGDTVSGVTTMFTEAGVDTGPMLLKDEVPIGPDMTSQELAEELSARGAKLLIETLKQLRAGTLKAQPQDESKATLAPMMTKELGHLSWKKPAAELHNLVRGLIPWPGTYTKYKGAPLKVHKTRVDKLLSGSEAMTPGAVAQAGSRVLIACGSDGKDRLELVDVQPANKARMSARDWANGVRLKEGDILGA